MTTSSAAGLMMRSPIHSTDFVNWTTASGPAARDRR